VPNLARHESKRIDSHRVGVCAALSGPNEREPPVGVLVNLNAPSAPRLRYMESGATSHRCPGLAAVFEVEKSS
jgi:hypothetical protein